MLNKIRILFRVNVWNKVFPPREAEKRFVNPYAMTDAVTPKYNVQPKFKDGRFILDGKENPFSARYSKPEKKPDEKPVPKKKEPGFSKACLDVILSDIEYISGETRRKARKIVTEEEAQKHLTELILKEQKPFVREPTIQPVIDNPIVVKPPALEPNVITPKGMPEFKPDVNPQVRMFDPVVKMLKRNMLLRKPAKPVVVEYPFVDTAVKIEPERKYDVTEICKKQPEDNDEWIVWATEPAKPKV